MKNYKWASLGCGVIANLLAQALEKRGTKLYSIANRTHSKAVEFAKKYGIEKVYDKIDDVFQDPEVDIIYISTPHNKHIEFIRKALKAKKHCFCEKSVTLNTAELEEAMSLAKENGVVFGEAMSLYHMPLYQELDKVIASGKLGKLQLINVSFGSYKEYDMTNRFFSRELAGGAMLDIGVYALAFVRYFMSSAPEIFASNVVLSPTGVDERATITLKNSQDELASVSLSLHCKQPKRGTVCFDSGFIEIYDYNRGQRAEITYTEDGHKEIVEAGISDDFLMYETIDMEKAVDGDRNVLHLDYSYDVMKIMTNLRKSWNVGYPEECR